MIANIPWVFVLAFGMFIGLLVGNAKFRDECDAILARIMGGSKGKKKVDPDIQSDNDEEECVICGNGGARVLVFDNNRGICLQCLEEIIKPQSSRPMRRRVESR